MTAIAAVIGLLFGAVLPSAQAVAASSEAGTLLAAICSPNGIRYVEIEFGDAEPDDPRPPLLGGLDHCPGCLGGGAPALLPAANTVAPPSVDASCGPAFAGLDVAQRTETCFRSRAPPSAS